MTTHRIALIGPGGSGKTTLARALAAELHLPLIEEQFRIARHLVAVSNAPEADRPRLEQETGIMRQVEIESSTAHKGFISDRSIYDYMIYSNLRGITWPADYPHPIHQAAERWWRNVGGYTLVVYVPPFSDAPPEDDGERYTDPDFVRREREAFDFVRRYTPESILPVLSEMPVDTRISEVKDLLRRHLPTKWPVVLHENHNTIRAAIRAAREDKRPIFLYPRLLLLRTLHEAGKLSTRAYNALRSQGYYGDRSLDPILTVGDLVEYTERELLKRRCFGLQCLVEVRQILAEMDLSLREDSPTDKTI